LHQCVGGTDVWIEAAGGRRDRVDGYQRIGGQAILVAIGSRAVFDRVDQLLVGRAQVRAA
jgi:hypothetical protein